MQFVFTGKMENGEQLSSSSSIMEGSIVSSIWLQGESYSGGTKLLLPHETRHPFYLRKPPPSVAEKGEKELKLLERRCNLDAHVEATGSYSSDSKRILEVMKMSSAKAKVNKLDVKLFQKLRDDEASFSRLLKRVEYIKLEKSSETTRTKQNKITLKNSLGRTMDSSTFPTDALLSKTTTSTTPISPAITQSVQSASFSESSGNMGNDSNSSFDNFDETVIPILVEALTGPKSPELSLRKSFFVSPRSRNITDFVNTNPERSPATRFQGWLTSLYALLSLLTIRHTFDSIHNLILSSGVRWPSAKKIQRCWRHHKNIAQRKAKNFQITGLTPKKHELFLARCRSSTLIVTFIKDIRKGIKATVLNFVRTVRRLQIYVRRHQYRSRCRLELLCRLFDRFVPCLLPHLKIILSNKGFDIPMSSLETSIVTKMLRSVSNSPHACINSLSTPALHKYLRENIKHVKCIQQKVYKGKLIIDPAQRRYLLQQMLFRMRRQYARKKYQEMQPKLDIPQFTVEDARSLIVKNQDVLSNHIHSFLREEHRKATEIVMIKSSLGKMIRKRFVTIPPYQHLIRDITAYDLLQVLFQMFGKQSNVGGGGGSSGGSGDGSGESAGRGGVGGRRQGIVKLDATDLTLVTSGRLTEENGNEEEEEEDMDDDLEDVGSSHHMNSPSRSPSRSRDRDRDRERDREGDREGDEALENNDISNEDHDLTDIDLDLGHGNAAMTSNSYLEIHEDAESYDNVINSHSHGSSRERDSKTSTVLRPSSPVSEKQSRRNSFRKRALL